MTGRMTDEEIKKILANIEAQPVPPTMLAELTESQRRMVYATLHGVEMIVEKVIEKRDKAERSFWRAVFDALWSGVTQAHALLQKLFKE